MGFEEGSKRDRRREEEGRVMADINDRPPNETQGGGADALHTVASYGVNGQDGANGHYRCHGMATHGTRRKKNGVIRVAIISQHTEKNGVLGLQRCCSLREKMA